MFSFNVYHWFQALKVLVSADMPMFKLWAYYNLWIWIFQSNAIWDDCFIDVLLFEYVLQRRWTNKDRADTGLYNCMLRNVMQLYKIVTCWDSRSFRCGMQRYCKPVILVILKFLIRYIINLERWPFWLCIVCTLWATATRLIFFIFFTFRGPCIVIYSYNSC